MSVNAEDLRNAMRQWATGVTVVTVDYEGVRHGMTVSSFTSVSLEPPLVLVSLERGSKTHNLLEKSGYFAVTILCDDQQDISERFSGGVPDGHDRFAGLQTFTLVSGAPLLMQGESSLDSRWPSVRDVRVYRHARERPERGSHWPRRLSESALLSGCPIALVHQAATSAASTV